jgi:L-lactate permease
MGIFYSVWACAMTLVYLNVNEAEEEKWFMFFLFSSYVFAISRLINNIWQVSEMGLIIGGFFLVAVIMFTRMRLETRRQLREDEAEKKEQDDLNAETIKKERMKEYAFVETLLGQEVFLAMISRPLTLDEINPGHPRKTFDSWVAQKGHVQSEDDVQKFANRYISFAR